MTTYIHHHLGLGDHIVCNGLVRSIATRGDVVVFCKEQNFNNVEFMYRDADNIKVFPIPSGKDEHEFTTMVAGERLMSIGFHPMYILSLSNKGKAFDELFYLAADVDYSERFDGFYMERDMGEEERVYDKLVWGGEYIFVHDDHNRCDEYNEDGYIIDVKTNLRIIRNDMSERLFSMGLVIERAKEVHLMESSLKCYVEHLTLSGELFFHPIRKYTYPTLTADNTRHKWTIVENLIS